MSHSKNESFRGDECGGPVALSGYLHKMKKNQRKLVPIWNKRWFILQGKELKYYANQKDLTSLEPSKVISLLDISMIRSFEKGDHGAYRFITLYIRANQTVKSIQCSFVLKAPDRSYFLRAESEGEMKKWVRSLREHQDLWRQKEEGSNSTRTTTPAKHYRSYELKNANSTSKTESVVRSSDDDEDDYNNNRHIRVS